MAEYPDGADWDGLIEPSAALSDIIQTSLWRPAPITRRWVLPAHEDLPAAEEGWCFVSTAMEFLDDDAPPPLPAFTYSEIGRRGLDQWLEMHSELSLFRRALLPLSRLPLLTNTFIDGQINQLGIGLEALGYAIGKESGKPKGDYQYYSQRIRLIVDQVDPDGHIFLPDSNQFLANTYNGVKHADRPLPEISSVEEALKVGSALYRLWVMRRLGASEQSVHDAAIHMML